MKKLGTISLRALLIIFVISIFGCGEQKIIPPEYYAECHGDHYPQSASGSELELDLILHVEYSEWNRVTTVLNGIAEEYDMYYFDTGYGSEYNEESINCDSLSCAYDFWVCSSGGFQLNARQVRSGESTIVKVNVPDVDVPLLVGFFDPMDIRINLYNKPESWQKVTTLIKETIEAEWPGKLELRPRYSTPKFLDTYSLTMQPDMSKNIRSRLENFCVNNGLVFKTIENRSEYVPYSVWCNKQVGEQDFIEAISITNIQGENRLSVSFREDSENVELQPQTIRSKFISEFVTDPENNWQPFISKKKMTDNEQSQD